MGVGGMYMSLAVLQKTHESIDRAFKTKDIDLMEKEAKFVLYSLSDFIPEYFSESVRYIKLRNTILKSPKHDMYEKYRTDLIQAIDLLEEDHTVTKDFSEIKMVLEKLFINLTTDGYIDYEYEKAELLSVEEAAEILSVSRPTIYRYLEKGLEFKEINNVKKIPRVALKLWKDPAKAFEMQWLFQQKQLRGQSLEKKIEKISRKIQALELEFAGDFNTLYGQMSEKEIDGLDEAFDVLEWRELLLEKNKLLRKLQEKIEN